MKDPNANLMKLLGICKNRSVNALVEIHAGMAGYAAYEALCENLGITPIMDSHSYNCARPDLAKKHLTKLFESWCFAKGIPSSRIHIPRADDGDCRIEWDFGGMPPIYFLHPKMGVKNPVEHLIHIFSIYWRLYGENPA